MATTPSSIPRQLLRLPSFLLLLQYYCWLFRDVAMAAVVPVPEMVTYRVGGLSTSGDKAFLESFGITFSAYLNQTVGEVYPGVGFVAVPLAGEDVWDAVSSSSVDFLFLNPSLASCMDSEFGASAVLSLRNVRQGNELNTFGGTVITAANRTDITTIADLEGKIVEGVSFTGLGAFQLLWGLVQEAGLNLMADPSEVRLAYNQTKIVYDVIAGSTDVGFVRTDMVERMDAAGEVSIADVSFVFVRDDIADSGFPFPTSTDLVPEWPLQALPHVPADVVKEVVRALMMVNETHQAAVSGAYSTWDAPLSYSQLRALQAQLGVLDVEEWRCGQSEDIYGTVICPEGYFKVSEDRFESQCTDLGKTCPDGYTCLCRPCELLPEKEYSFSLHFSGDAVSTGECKRMTTCAAGIVAFSSLTVRLVDNWGPARETLGLNHTNALEVHVITGGEAMACYAAGHGQFPCSQSVVHDGAGAPPLNTTQRSLQLWEDELEVEMGAAGSTLLRIVVDGQDDFHSPTLLGVEEPSCGDVVYTSHISSCYNNASRRMSFNWADEWEDVCGGFVDLPSDAYDLGCDYTPWGSGAGIVAIVCSAGVMAVAATLTVWTVIHRAARSLVAAQWVFCVVFSASIALSALGGMFIAGEPTNVSCFAEPIMFNLGAGTAISSLFVKIWRGHTVWNAGMRRVRITNSTLFRYIAALLSVDVVLLAAMCIVHFPRASHFYTPELVSGVLVDVDHVACDYGRLESVVAQVLGGYHALIAVSACVTSFKARKMGSQYMETRGIVASTLVVGTLKVVSMTTNCDVTCRVLVGSAFKTASATIALVCIFGPKVVRVHLGNASIFSEFSSAPRPPVDNSTSVPIQPTGLKNVAVKPYAATRELTSH